MLLTQPEVVIDVIARITHIFAITAAGVRTSALHRTVCLGSTDPVVGARANRQKLIAIWKGAA
jgi:hypothetical protein